MFRNLRKFLDTIAKTQATYDLAPVVQTVRETKSRQRDDVDVLLGEHRMTNGIDHKKVLDTAKGIEETRSGLVITGKIVNGKLEIDQHVLDEIARKFPSANRSFVAVNAPFDPNGVTGTYGAASAT
jgi:hypothetical protein